MRTLLAPHFSLFSELEKDMGRMLAPNRSAPTFDFVEKDSHYLLSVDLPGVRKEDINLSLKEGVLTVAGERVSKLHKEYQDNYRYGSFSRSLRLPNDIIEEVTAHLEDGVLFIAIAKKAPPEKKEISISQGDKKDLWHQLLDHQKKKGDEPGGQTTIDIT